MQRKNYLEVPILMDTTIEFLLNYIDMRNNKQTKQVVLIYLGACVYKHICVYVCVTITKRVYNFEREQGLEVLQVVKVRRK